MDARIAHRRPRRGDRAVPRDGGADGRARARGGRAHGRPHGDRRARLPDAGAGDRRRAAGASPTGDIYYTSALGLPALREAIARHYADHYGVDVAPERVIVTAGSSAALLLVLALIVNRDDRILLADPGYPCNRHFVRVLEGEPVGIPVGPETELPADGDARSSATGRAARAAR